MLPVYAQVMASRGMLLYPVLFHAWRPISFSDAALTQLISLLRERGFASGIWEKRRTSRSGIGVMRDDTALASAEIRALVTQVRQGALQKLISIEHIDPNSEITVELRALLSTEVTLGQYAEAVVFRRPSGADDRSAWVVAGALSQILSLICERHGWRYFASHGVNSCGNHTYREHKDPIIYVFFCGCSPLAAFASRITRRD